MTSSSSSLLVQLDSILSSNGIQFTNHYSSTSNIDVESERRIQERDSSTSTITVHRQDTPTVKSLAKLTEKLKVDSKVNSNHSVLTDSPSTALFIPPWKDSASQSEGLDLNDIGSQDWDRIADVFKSLADACRSDSPRTSLGQSNLPSFLSLLLSFTIQSSSNDKSSKEIQETISNKVQTELLRSIANLCIDHDINRSLMLSVDIPNKILQVLEGLISDIEDQESSTTALKMETLVKLRTALGCFLNLQLEHNEIKKDLLRSSLKSASSNESFTEISMDFLPILLRISTNPKIYLPASWCLSLNSTPSHPSLEHLLISSTISKWSFRILTELLTPLEKSKDSQSETDSDETSSDDNGEIDEVNDLIRKVKYKSSSNPSLLKWILRPFHHFLNKNTQLTTSSDLEISSEDVDGLIDSDAEVLSNLSEFWHGLSEDCCLEFKLRMINQDQEQNQNQLPLETLMDFIEFSSHPQEWEPDRIEESKIEKPEDVEAALESIKAFSVNKALIGKSLILIVSEDRLMESLFTLDDSNGPRNSRWFIQKCLSWLKLESKSRSDLISLGILCIGNLARKDINCIKLLGLTYIGRILFALLKSALFPSNVDSVKSSKPNLPSSEDLKIIHSILGLLKNLSIPKINKSKLTNSNFIELVSHCLDSKFDRIQPVQFLAVGVLKNLASTPSGEGGIRLSNKSIQSELMDPQSNQNTIEKVLGLVKRSEDVPIKLEGSRILVNAIKYLWSPQSVEDQKVDQELLSKSRDLLIRRGITDVLSEMVRDCEKYPILINEGIFALTLLASSERGARLVAVSLTKSHQAKAITESNEEAVATTSKDQPLNTSNNDSTALSMIKSILSLQNPSIPIEFVINCCSLINSLASTEVQPQLLSDDEVAKFDPQAQERDRDSEEWQADFKKSEEALNQIERGVRRSLQNLIDDTVSPKEVLKPANIALQSCGKRFSL